MALSPVRREGDPDGIARAVGEVPADGANPADVTFSCALEPDALAGQARWATALFEPYANDPDSAYVRGCIDECGALRDGQIGGNPCNVPEDWALSIGCRGDRNAFGRLVCEESCDGQDNTGDGIIDAPPPGWAAIGEACDTGEAGVCAQGRVACENGVFSCAPLPLAAVSGGDIDYCDGLDNNCDGAVDENADRPAPGVVRAAGHECTAMGPNGAPLLGICAAGRLDCAAGTLVCRQQVQAGAEICDGQDNNCDGTVDDGLGADVLCQDGPACVVPGAQGACREGVTACAQGNDNACVPLVRPGQYAEACNGLDDDCDSLVDEPPDAGPDPCLETRLLRYNAPVFLTAASDDGEFDGHGPRVEVELQLRPEVDGVVVQIRVTMDETGGHNTHGEYQGEARLDFGGAIDLITPQTIRVAYTDRGHGVDTVVDHGRMDHGRVIAGTVDDLLVLRCLGDANGTDLRFDDDDEPPRSFCWIELSVRGRRRVAAVSTCGNGVIEEGEGCDDANRCGGDGCTAICQPEL